MSETIDDLLIRHEGLKLKLYKDTVGKLTIGVGRNLDDVGITDEEARFLLSNDIHNCTELALKHFAWFLSLTENRQNVIISMIFNMGIGKLLEFRNMLAQIEAGYCDKAADAMLDSLWAKEVGQRAIELSLLMRNG